MGLQLCEWEGKGLQRELQCALQILWRTTPHRCGRLHESYGNYAVFGCFNFMKHIRSAYRTYLALRSYLLCLLPTEQAYRY